jgi:hypothetical protein
MAGVPQPSGTVTLVFADIEGSTRPLSEVGPDDYRELLADQTEMGREGFEPSTLGLGAPQYLG